MKETQKSTVKMDILTGGTGRHCQKGIFTRKEVKSVPKHFTKTKTYQCKKQQSLEDESGCKSRLCTVIIGLKVGL